MNNICIENIKVYTNNLISSNSSNKSELNNFIKNIYNEVDNLWMYNLNESDKEEINNVINSLKIYFIKHNKLIDEEGIEIPSSEYKNLNLIYWKLNNTLDNVVLPKYNRLSTKSLNDIIDFIEDYLEFLNIDVYEDIDIKYLETLNSVIRYIFNIESKDYFNKIMLEGISDDNDYQDLIDTILLKVFSYDKKIRLLYNTKEISDNEYNIFMKEFSDLDNTLNEYLENCKEHPITIDENVKHKTTAVADLSKAKGSCPNTTDKRAGGERGCSPFLANMRKMDVISPHLSDIIDNDLKRFYKLLTKERVIIKSSISKRKTLSSNIAKFMVHILHSYPGDFNLGVPVSNQWLRRNGFESLTRMKLLNLSLCYVEDTSLDVLEGLRLININKIASVEKRLSNEYSLSLIGKAITSIILLEKRFYFRTPNFGDKLFYDNVNIDYIYSRYGILPNEFLIRSVFTKLNSDKRKFNYINYKKNREELSEFIAMSKSDYKDKIMYYIIEDNLEELEVELNILSKLTVDQYKISNVHDFGRDKKGWYRYLVLCHMAKTGRLCESNGFQGLSRISKYLLVKDIPNVYNYDISSSQIRALLQFLDHIGYNYKDSFNEEDKKSFKNVEYLKEYLIKDKSIIADRLGITVEDWKKILYSVVFGSNPDNPQGTVRKILLKYKEVDLDYFNHIKNTLFSPIRLWLKYVRQYSEDFELTYDNKVLLNSILRHYPNIDIDLTEDKMLYNGVIFMKLDSIYLRDVKTLSAFWLQGLEASYIYNLIALAPNEVLSNEHDGIIVLEKLSNDSIEDAKRRSNFNNVKIVEKELLISSEKLLMKKKGL